ncbi:MAG: glycosyltransferase family 4 protein [Deltaproteobacteria bacterium]|nr:glycosyltransferase family 4 protein [Deltaproteobacteria bacterium]
MSSSVAPWTIVIYTEGLTFDGATLYETGLGGSESAVCFMARELAARGHAVEVFCRTRRPGIYEGVRYRPIAEFPGAAAGRRFDVFIASRTPQVFLLPLRCRLAVMWNHDNLLQPEQYRQMTFRAEIIFTLSAYHEAEFLAQLPDLAPRLVRTRNGVDLDLTETARRGALKNRRRLIYASRPERGLEVLLEQIWPRLLARRPDLELCLCGYQAPDMPGHDHLPALVAQAPRLTALGSLGKREYYRHLAEAAVAVYPCTFPEISCIVALEAQAVGTPIITTHDFALPETVGVADYLIGGRPALPSYQEAFVERVLDYLTDGDRYRRDAARALAHVRQRHAWSAVAGEWEELFARHLAGKDRKASPHYSLVRLRDHGGPATVGPGLSLAPPPLEAKVMPRPGGLLASVPWREALEQETRGDWILVVEDGPPAMLPPLLPYLESHGVDWFAFRRASAPAGWVAAVLFRRGRPLSPRNLFLVGLGEEPCAP